MASELKNFQKLGNFSGTICKSIDYVKNESILKKDSIGYSHKMAEYIKIQSTEDDENNKDIYKSKKLKEDGSLGEEELVLPKNEVSNFINVIVTIDNASSS